MAGYNAIPKLAPCVISLQYSCAPNSHILSPFSTFHIFALGVMQGVPPATVAEWTLQGNGNNDFYDGAREIFLPILPSIIRKRPY
jgi:hypothetical protein